MFLKPMEPGLFCHAKKWLGSSFPELYISIFLPCDIQVLSPALWLTCCYSNTKLVIIRLKPTVSVDFVFFNSSIFLDSDINSIQEAED